MQELTGFSDLLSQLSPFSSSGIGSGPENAASQPPSVGTDAPEARLPAPIASNLPSASFDSAPAPPADLAGVYRAPSAAIQQRTSTALDFQFSLAVRQEVSTVRSRSSEEAPAHSRPSHSRMVAREQTSLSYQSLQALYRNSAGGSFREVRGFQAQMFRSQTRQISSRLDQDTGNRLDRTAQRVSRSFELNIKLEASFLTQFVQQSNEISEVGKGALGQYLDNTDRFADVSGEAMQGFFDQVEGFLADAEALVEETLTGFFSDVAASFGMSDSEIGALRGMVTDQVTAFFNDVDQFLDDARLVMAGPASRPEMAEPELATQPLPPQAEAPESDPEVA